MTAIFISGIGTDVGKTVVSAIVTQALQADYWKPVQAGYEKGTDSQWIGRSLSNPQSQICKESYMLRTPASPHIAARIEGKEIDLELIQKDFNQIAQGRANGHVPQWLVIEGAGGLLVPLNGSSFIIDLVKLLKAKLLLVSRNYLGSINHSLLTARACREMNIPVEGWIFNCQYLDYENEIASWTGFRKIGSIPFHAIPDREFVAEQAKVIEPVLRQILDVKT